MYNVFESSVSAARGEEDIFGNVAAGAATGLLFKSTGALFVRAWGRSWLTRTLFSCLAGVKAAGLAAAIGAAFMAVATAGSEYMERYVF